MATKLHWPKIEEEIMLKYRVSIEQAPHNRPMAAKKSRIAAERRQSGIERQNQTGRRVP